MAARRFLALLLLPGAAGCLATQSSVQAGLEEIRADQKIQMEEQRHRIETLQGQVQDLQDTLADQGARIDQIEENLRHLTGGMEEKEHVAQLTLGETKALKQAYDARLQGLEGQLKALQEAATRAAAIQAEEREKWDDPRVALEDGTEAARKKHCDDAREALRYLLKRWPHAPEAVQAHYWLGDCAMRDKDWLQAISEYGNLIEKFPKDPKTPSALLRAGQAFEALDKKTEARLFYRRLVDHYAKAPEAREAKKRLAAKKKP